MYHIWAFKEEDEEENHIKVIKIIYENCSAIHLNCKEYLHQC